MRTITKLFILSSIALLPSMLLGQTPWIMSTGTATYEVYQQGPPPQTTQTVNMTDSADVLEICYTNSFNFIRTNSIAGTYIMGPWDMNPNVPIATQNVFKITRNPTEELGTKTPTPWGGPLGIAVNGVKLYGYGDARSYSSQQDANVSNGDGNWNSDAWVSEGLTMDATGNGHADGQGNYHYHANPVKLYSYPSTSHSPIIGFAFDGYPIYGPLGYTDPNDTSSAIVRIESSYEIRNISQRTILPDGSTSMPAGPAVTTGGNFDIGTYIEDYEYINGAGHLDQYNGRVCKTPEYPNGTYAYFMTIKPNGDPAFPYLLHSEYYGEVAANLVGAQAGNASIPTAATCGVITSLNAVTEIKDLTLYPNPTDDKLIIEIEELGTYNLKIVNMQGGIVLEKEYDNKGFIELTMKSLSSGAYSVVLINQETGTIYNNKVVVNSK